MYCGRTRQREIRTSKCFKKTFLDSDFPSGESRVWVWLRYSFQCSSSAMLLQSQFQADHKWVLTPEPTRGDISPTMPIWFALHSLQPHLLVPLFPSLPKPFWPLWGFLNMLNILLPQGLCTFTLPIMLFSNISIKFFPFPQARLLSMLPSQWGLSSLSYLKLHRDTYSCYLSFHTSTPKKAFITF